jgi:hypothetical protein
MSVDFDVYSFENKVRVMIIELINPTVRRMGELQESMEEVFRHDMIHQKRLDAMEFNWSTFQSKLVLIDEVFKIAQDLKSNNQIFESEINQKIQSITGNVQKAVHKVDDMNMKILTIDENFKTARTEITEYANTVNYLKSAIIEEQKTLARVVEKQVADMKKLWMKTSDRLDKAEHAVLAFTDNSLPKMMADVEKNFRMIREIKKDLKESADKKVDLVEFAKLKKTLQFDQDKIKENIDSLASNHSKTEEYLENFLPIEQWNAISEAICKLHPKHLKAFIEHDEAKMEQLRSKTQAEHTSIQELVSKALHSYEQHISRREIMKIEVEKAELEKVSALNRARNGSSNRRIVYDSSSELKRQNKRRDKRRHLPSDHSPSETFPRPPSSNNTSDKHEIVPGEQINEVDEKSADITKVDELKEEEKRLNGLENDLQEKREENKAQENKEQLVDEFGEGKVEDEQRFGERSQVFNEKVDIIENLEVNRFEGNSFFRYMPGSESSESNELPLASAGFYHDMPKVDLSGIEAEIQILRSQQEDIMQKQQELLAASQSNSEKIDNTACKLEEFMATVSTQQGNIETDLKTNLSLIHEEIKQIILRNKQEKTDLVRQISLYHSDFKSSTSNLDKIELTLSTLTESFTSLSEIFKIIHLLTSQEEEDRQSLQLLGYSESKTQKPYISLKSDCMSCSGQNPTILSAFKMACLNYSPSGIKYKQRTYTRKQLISVLGSLVNHSLSQSTSRAPRYASELGSYQSIPTLIEESLPQARHKYNRSQFIELPSLNASKLFSEHETPFSSTREIRKLN